MVVHEGLEHSYRVTQSDGQRIRQSERFPLSAFERCNLESNAVPQSRSNDFDAAQVEVIIDARPRESSVEMPVCDIAGQSELGLARPLKPGDVDP